MNDSSYELKIENSWIEFLGWFNLDKHKEHLLKLWKEAQPMTEDELKLIEQITGLSRCNWNLEPIVQSLIQGIGKGKKSELRIGHKYSITKERWMKCWAYYLAIKRYLTRIGWTGLSTLEKSVDPKEKIREHVHELLGDKTPLKELYLELFCYFFEINLMGLYSEESITRRSVQAAKDVLVEEIKKYNYDKMILAAVKLTYLEESQVEGISWFEVCHHKFFRRMDIILSSIEVNKWRGKIPVGGTGKQELLELIRKHITKLDLWLEMKSEDKILGKHSHVKIFQASPT